MYACANSKSYALLCWVGNTDWNPVSDFLMRCMDSGLAHAYTLLCVACVRVAQDSSELWQPFLLERIREVGMGLFIKILVVVFIN